MAEEIKPVEPATTQDMEVENPETDQLDPDENGSKRSREEEVEEGESKKQKKGEEDKSVEEERLEKLDEVAVGETDSGPVNVGPKSFGSSVEMFDYFYKFLHYWPPNLNVNKYEQLMLLDLLKKGHPEPEKKIGGGIKAFQVRYHPMWKSRCFFLVREDDTADDFSFRKCVDHILPLPEDMKAKSDINKALGGRASGGKFGGGGNGGGGGRGGRGRGRGRGRGGKWRN